MIVAEKLGKHFDDFKVLNDISFQIEEGDIYGLIGMSGAGKSTLLRCINALTPYQEGSLKVFGKEVKSLEDKELRDFRRDIGMVFQNFALIERKSAYKNIALPMESWGYSKEEIEHNVHRLLKLVGLEEKKDRKPRNLSGGEKQRVAVARALTLNPKILLSDEATSSLDPRTTLQILDLYQKIQEELGITIVVVTHQMEVITTICNRVSVLEQGEIEISGLTEEVFEDRPDALLRLLGKTS